MQAVVEERERRRDGDSPVRGDVGRRRNARWEWRIAAQVAEVQSGERSLAPPLGDRVEDQLGASEGTAARGGQPRGSTPPYFGKDSLLLPAVELIVTSERDTLLVAELRVRRPSGDVTGPIQAKGHDEVFRDVLLGPDLATLVLERLVLQSGPAEESVVTPEREKVVSAPVLPIPVERVSLLT